MKHTIRNANCEAKAGCRLGVHAPPATLRHAVEHTSQFNTAPGRSPLRHFIYSSLAINRFGCGHAGGWGIGTINANSKLVSVAARI
jgi:hypothetical protein